MKLLRQMTSGYIYPWTPQLAERADMEPFEQENTRENQAEASVQPTPPTEVSKAIEAFRAGLKPGRKAKPKPGGA